VLKSGRTQLRVRIPGVTELEPARPLAAGGADAPPRGAPPAGRADAEAAGGRAGAEDAEEWEEEEGASLLSPSGQGGALLQPVEDFDDAAPARLGTGVARAALGPAAGLSAGGGCGRWSLRRR
jgi:hypothetical protein